jgi:alpha-L-fucosidase
MKRFSISLVLLCILSTGLIVQCSEKSDKTPGKKVKYLPNWESLAQWEVPKWFDQAVLGIYCHWSVYSVPGYRFNSGS